MSRCFSGEISFWWVHDINQGVAYVQDVHYIIDAVFASPETVQLKAWRDILSCSLVKKRLVCVVIDEAHCVAEWSVGMFLYPILYTAWGDFRGSDFRTAFCKPGGLRSLIDAQFMALSVSAPSPVQDIIIEMLCLQSLDIVSRDLDRGNIFMSVSSILSLAVSVCKSLCELNVIQIYPTFSVTYMVCSVS